MSDDLLNNQGTDYAESTFSSGSHVKSIRAANVSYEIRLIKGPTDIQIGI